MNKYILILATIILCSANLIKRGERKINGKVTEAQTGNPLIGASVSVKGTKRATLTDSNGRYEISISNEKEVLIFSLIGYSSKRCEVKGNTVINASLQPDAKELKEVVVTGYGTQKRSSLTGGIASVPYSAQEDKSLAISASPIASYDQIAENYNTEEYDGIHENIFHETTKNPLSTFSIDVDAASYSNVRRFLNNGQMPPKDAVRIEEMINYFDYNYPQPKGDDPFSVSTEISTCPWNPDTRLVHIGLQGKNIATDNLPASNLVFLIDVSGSMQDANKLPLLKSAFHLLIEQLRPEDKISLVVYAGAAGVVLPSTSGKNKSEIIEALNRLEAGGSTAGGEGIKLAYVVAKENFIKGGNNRVILATDGDFNVGVSSNGEMERLIEEKRESGVFLSVLGFGMGNYKDSKMEVIADKGNGNYAYIDNILEAKKVFVNEFGGTLFTIAKDVKLQIEFNPRKVKAYRLVGYENRALKNEDFNNDKKDAGDLGSGHSVTALYEIIPADSKNTLSVQKIDSLKYQTVAIKSKASSNEVMTLKLRYKAPDKDISKLIEKITVDENIPLNKTSENYKFSAAVAEFGMILRGSEFKSKATYADVIRLAEESKGEDKEGYRIEFIRLVKSCSLMAEK